MTATSPPPPTTGGDLLLTGIGELVTNADDAPDLLGVVRRAAVAIRHGRIAWVGPEVELPDSFRDGSEELDCEGRAALPGFVDAHTHLPFVGDRADEFARRLRGETYPEVLRSGGGILATVRATRKASVDDLVAAMRPRADRMVAFGTTTAEAKSGYGLDIETERRQLEAIAALNRTHPLELVPTYLGAHALPIEYREDRWGYVDLVAGRGLAAVRDHAQFVDVFCDQGAFTVDEARAVLRAGGRAGLGLRVHANELAASGGAQLAAELGAASADHLAYVDQHDARALAEAGVVAVLLPTTTFSLRTRRYAPGRELWDAGVTIGLGTDCNPGTSYTESMPFVVALACLELGLTPEEAVWAATRGSALSLRRNDIGRVTVGARGDVVVLDAPSYRHLPYRPGTNLAWRTVVAERRPVRDT